MKNAITWFEIPTTQLDRAQAFYEAVLGQPMRRENMGPSEGAVFAYGKFLTAVLKFAIVAWVMFLIIKGMNTMKRKQEAAPETPPEVPADVKLLTEIRDLLKK